jgi:hypothetical protein
MPRQQQSSGSGLTAGQALYVLDRLLRERRINSREVERMASEMQAEIADLERRLAMLRMEGSASGSKGRSAGRRGSSRPVNPAVAASRKLQGEYMGLMRHLNGKDRARVKKIAKEKGREAAVKAMRSQLGR